MKTSSESTSALTKRIDALEAQQLALTEALKLLLPLAIGIPACTTDSAGAIKELAQALKNAEAIAPRSPDFWHLGGAMALALSSRALDQHPQDQEVAAIFQGLRAHRRQ